MKRSRERFDAEVAEIQKALLPIGARGQVRSANLLRSRPGEDDLSKAKRLTVTSSGLMATAYQLAGYAVAMLALGRSLPLQIVLKEDAEFHLGRCSEGDLDIIWAVGDLAAERRSEEPGQPGPTVVIVKLESDIGGAMHDKRVAAEAAMEPDQSAKAILDENWDDVVRVAHLLIEKRTASRDEVEAEVFEPDEATQAP
jgi:hypothetical protein